MAKYMVTFGVGFGNCTSRRDSTLIRVIECKSERAAKMRAKKIWNAYFGKNADDYGFVIDKMEKITD